MEETQAHAIGERLAQAADSTPEEAWAMWAALMAFPSSSEDVWVPRDQATAHWVEGQALVSATAEGQASLRIVARPVVQGDWGIDVKFQSAQLNDAGFARPGLKSHWAFKLSGGEDFEIDGETLVSRDSSRPDEAETLARQVAGQMIGPGGDAA